MTTLMKRRGGSFRQAKRNTGGSGGGKGESKRRSGIVDGTFDRWYPNSASTWVHFPVQTYNFELYVKEEKEVVAFEDWPVYEYVTHFIPKGNTKFKKFPMNFVCSSGARLTGPCYGCAKRKEHYDRMEAIKQETGIKPQEWAPISKGNRIALSVAIMEIIYQIPKIKDGKVHKTKKGTTIYTYVPEPSADDVEEMKGVSSKFGHRAHWNFSPAQYAQLQEFDEQLRNYCENCATPLTATAFICPDCEATRELKQPISGIDLYEQRKKSRKCTACGFTGSAEQEWIPDLMCTGCEQPAEGKLMGCFDLRIRSVRSADNSNVLQLNEVRKPGSQDAAINAEIMKLMANPLDIVQIYAPESLERQKSLIDPEVLEGIDPNTAKMATAYGEEEEQEADEELNLPNSLD